MLALGTEPKSVEDVPVCISLTENPVVGIYGKSQDTAAMLKSIILQMAALHSSGKLSSSMVNFFSGHVISAFSGSLPSPSRIIRKSFCPTDRSRLLTVNNVLRSGGNIAQAMPSVLMSFSMLLGTVLWPNPII